jgi:membrane protease subunit HflK
MTNAKGIMTEQINKDNIGLAQNPESPGKTVGGELDTASRSLYEALRTSFVVLKIIMGLLIVVFLASGFRTVGSDEQALVLRFGKIRGAGEGRLLGPGLRWMLPYPVDEIIKIPVAKKINLPISCFWYFEREQKPPGTKTYVPPSLDPVKDGYCITRSEEQGLGDIASSGSDYNIIHSKWQLTYNIDDPERFFKNVYVSNIEPGQSYGDKIAESAASMLEDLFAGSAVTAMVNYTIDEALVSQDRIPLQVAKLLQEKLDRIESGVKVISVQLTDITWPRQVENAFLFSIKASQMSQKTISEARSYAENLLNETAGSVAVELFAALRDKNAGEQEKELLWSQLAGQAQEKIAKARAYRTRMVETARANADYLQRLQPEFRKHPKLVVQKIYQDAMEYIFNNIDEKMIIQPVKDGKSKEIRILLNRDPTIKPRAEKKESEKSAGGKEAGD